MSSNREVFSDAFKERVIGVDPGYAACGVVVVARRPAEPGYLVLLATTIRTSTGEPLPIRLRSLWDELGLTFDSLPGLVAIERQDRVHVGKSARGTTNASALGVREAVGVIRALAWQWDLRTVDVEPQQAKRTVLGPGAGTAGKAQVGRGLRTLLGSGYPRTPLTEHEADAAACAIWALREQELPAALRRAKR